MQKSAIISKILKHPYFIKPLSLQNLYNKKLYTISNQSVLYKKEFITVKDERIHKRELKVYTKTGDRGKTSTYLGERFSKDDDIFEALGTIDELSAHIGVIKEYAYEKKHPYCDQLERIQCLLQDIGTCVAKAPLIEEGKNTNETNNIEMSNIGELETWIDDYTLKLPLLKNFILPGGGKTSTALHVARTVCRRAERRVVRVSLVREVNSNVISYVNRLSDYLFTLARYASLLDKKKESIYISPESKKGKPAVNTETQTFSEV